MDKTAIFIYEKGQVQTLAELLLSTPEEKRKSLTVIALGADIEFILGERGIAFQSGRHLRTMPHEECMGYAEKLGREVLDDPSFSFFSYRSVPLVNVFMPVLQVYLMSVLYFVDVITSITETYPHYRRLIVLPSVNILLETSGILAPLELTAAVDVARLVGKKYNIVIVVPELKNNVRQARIRMSVILFNLKRRLFGLFLFVLNVYVAVVVPQKRIRILASDLWKNISSLMTMLPDTELLLLDRGESRKAGLAAIFKNRMRFVHTENFVSRTMRKKASVQVGLFVEQWERVRDMNTVVREAHARGHKLSPILLSALELIIARGGIRSLVAIDGSYALCEHMRPDIVLVRASLSTQIHFPILCYVARALQIPSIEVQHGLLYFGPISFINRPAVEYVATYGPLTSKGFKKFGYTDSTLFNVGSPRFDAYKTMREKKIPGNSEMKPFIIACMVPAILPHSWSDSYEVVEYLKNLASAAARIPNPLFILKLRPDPDNEAFYRRTIAETFGTIPHKIAQYEPLVDVIAESDAVVTIYSTTVLEGLISGRPVIYNGTLETHEVLGRELSEYAAAGALLMVRTSQELVQGLESLAQSPGRRRELVEKADLFMKQNYSFDGKASQKMAEVVRTLAKKQRK